MVIMSSLKIALLFSIVSTFIYCNPIDSIAQDALSFGGEENRGLGLFEGDMIFPTQLRNVVRDPNLKWLGRIVPYEIKTSQYSSSQIAIITSAMAEISRRTCIRFVRRTTQRDYIFISSLSGCYSAVGRIGGRQPLSLNNQGCVTKGIVMHELLHSLGIYHEQSRHDRDKYIQVILANVQPAQRRNFDKLTLSTTQTFGFRYDYSSIMHYPPKAFSVNGKDTILTKPPGRPIGQRSSLSAIDIGKIRKFYTCT